MLRKFSLIFLSVFLFFAFTMPAFARNGEGRIIYIEGQVKIQKAQEGSWITAEEGMAIKNGDKIKTFKLSSAEVAMDEDAKNVIRIEQQSEIVFSNITKKRSNLLNGKILAVLEALEPGSDFEVRTPTAACGVTGSGFFVETNGKNTTTGCHENNSYAKGIKKDGSFTSKAIVKEGFKCLIEKFKNPGPLKKLSRLEKRGWSSFRENLREHKNPPKTKKARSSKNSARGMSKRIRKVMDRESKMTDVQRIERFEEREQEKLETTGDGGNYP